MCKLLIHFTLRSNSKKTLISLNLVSNCLTLQLRSHFWVELSPEEKQLRSKCRKCWDKMFRFFILMKLLKKQLNISLLKRLMNLQLKKLIQKLKVKEKLKMNLLSLTSLKVKILFNTKLLLSKLRINTSMVTNLLEKSILLN